MVDLHPELAGELAGIQAVLNFEAGDLGLLLERVKGREKLTEGEWQAVQHVIEAAAEGKSWRPAHRTREAHTMERARMLYGLVEYMIIHNGLAPKAALADAGRYAGLTSRRIDQMFDELKLTGGWRLNVARGIYMKLVREGVPEKEAVARAKATMRFRGR